MFWDSWEHQNSGFRYIFNSPSLREFNQFLHFPASKTICRPIFRWQILACEAKRFWGTQKQLESDLWYFATPKTVISVFYGTLRLRKKWFLCFTKTLFLNDLDPVRPISTQETRLLPCFWLETCRKQPFTRNQSAMEAAVRFLRVLRAPKHWFLGNWNTHVPSLIQPIYTLFSIINHVTTRFPAQNIGIQAKKYDQAQRSGCNVVKAALRPPTRRFSCFAEPLIFNDYDSFWPVIARKGTHFAIFRLKTCD